MGKVNTFKIVNERLYTMVFDKGDPAKVNELIKLYGIWTNSDYLTDFFNDREDLLQNEFWSEKETDSEGKPLTVNEAVQRTIAGAKALLGHLVKVARGEIDATSLNEVFIDLYDEKEEIEKFDKAKAYAIVKPYWLRIYGIKINDTMFVITGGGIKLVEKMSQCDLLKKELVKLKIALNYLQNDKDIDGDLEELIDNS